VTPYFTTLLEWLQAHPGLIWGLASFSLVLFLVSLLVVPWMLIRIPADYFIRDSDVSGMWTDRPIRRRLWRGARNVLGSVLILAGICMLVLPGQGLLTLFVGFMVMHFPGKQGLERKVLSFRFIEKPVNTLRRKAGKAPLETEGHGPP